MQKPESLTYRNDRMKRQKRLPIAGKLKENEEKIQQSKNKENTLEKAGEKLKNVTKSAELENSL